MKKTAALLLADGFEEIEAITPYDLLTRAGIQVDLISVDNKDEVTGNIGLHVTDLIPMKDYDFTKADALILPGGDGYVHLKENPEVIEEIRKFDENPDKVLGAICAASSILGDMGLYKGKDYTCVPPLNGDFGGHFEDVHAVIDGKLVTGISVGGAFDFALDLIRVLLGDEAAKKIATDTCYTL